MLSRKTWTSEVVPILAQDMDFDEEYVAKAFGLDTLIDVMSEVLPNELQDTLKVKYLWNLKKNMLGQSLRLQ